MFFVLDNSHALYIHRVISDRTVMECICPCIHEKKTNECACPICVDFDYLLDAWHMQVVFFNCCCWCCCSHYLCAWLCIHSGRNGRKEGHAHAAVQTRVTKRKWTSTLISYPPPNPDLRSWLLCAARRSSTLGWSFLISQVRETTRVRRGGCHPNRPGRYRGRCWGSAPSPYPTLTFLSPWPPANTSLYLPASHTHTLTHTHVTAETYTPYYIFSVFLLPFLRR